MAAIFLAETTSSLVSEKIRFTSLVIGSINQAYMSWVKPQSTSCCSKFYPLCFNIRWTLRFGNYNILIWDQWKLIFVETLIFTGNKNCNMRYCAIDRHSTYTFEMSQCTAFSCSRNCPVRTVISLLSINFMLFIPSIFFHSIL